MHEMNLQATDAFTPRLAAAASLDELRELCRVHSNALGFQHFVYALRVPTNFSDARLIVIDGYPPSWVKRYFEQKHFDADPVMAYCARHVVPLCWSDLSLAHVGPAKRMMQDAADFGLRDGVSMPVHSPQGELGILSLAVDAEPDEARALCKRTLGQITIFAGYLHEAVRRVTGLAQACHSSLSPRETECLRWAADGKTSGEIAQLLDRSESTVNFHLNRAMKKLDVVNRQHAVAKAALQGLIQPLPF